MSSNWIQFKFLFDREVLAKIKSDISLLKNRNISKIVTNAYSVKDNTVRLFVEELKTETLIIPTKYPKNNMYEGRAYCLNIKGILYGQNVKKEDKSSKIPLHHDYFDIVWVCEELKNPPIAVEESSNQTIETELVSGVNEEIKEKLFCETMLEPKKEFQSDVSVLNPNYYKDNNDGNGDVIDFCNAHSLNFNRGNVIKYTTRAGKKYPDKELEDLEKAMVYLKREIEYVRRNIKK